MAANRALRKSITLGHADTSSGSVTFAGGDWTGRFHRALDRATQVTLATEEAFLGSLSMGDDHGSGEAFFKFRPQQQQGRSVRKLLWPDAMHLSGCPVNRLGGVEIGHERLAMGGFD